jgi:plastocyanin
MNDLCLRIQNLKGAAMWSRFISFLLAILVSQPVLAEVWQVYLGDNFFAPDSLVVALGDTVTWTNLEGTHNVVEVGDPPIFTSGPPAAPPWNYPFVFNLPLGTYSYQCELHAPEMSGYVTVIPYGTPPNIEFDEPGATEGATVGWGFRMTVSATDDDQDLVGYALSANDTLHWSDWSPYSAFFIADTTFSFLPDSATLISNNVLSPGSNLLYFRAIDSRDVLSPIITREVIVEDGRRPIMMPDVTGTYSGVDVYPDGSVYHQADTDFQIEFRAWPDYFSGAINAYRVRGIDGIWSDWFATPLRSFDGPQSGDYPLLLVARDIAGEVSDTLAYTMHLVEFALSDTILIVDETRDGNGNPGSPVDEAVDNFYREVLTGYTYRERDYGNLHEGDRYLSPYDLRNAGLILYHGDDFADVRLEENTGVLTEYLAQGGRLILTGWNVLDPFWTYGSDSIAFEPGSFGYEFLRLHGGRYQEGRNATGLGGVGAFPDVSIDPEKLPSSFQGAIDRTWVFSPRDDFTEIGAMEVNNSGENPLEGRTAAYYFDGDYQIAVFGIPLYYCMSSEVRILLDILIPPMMEPVAVPPRSRLPVSQFSLEQNFPNPFNGTTEINFSISQTDQVSILVYDVLGRRIATLLDDRVPAGVHRVSFDGSNVASGIYFIQLSSGNFNAVRKMILLK